MLYMLKNYNPLDWYWDVTGKTGIYSSARQAYVPKTDDVYKAWLADGGIATKLNSEDELVGVLQNAKVPPYHKVSPYVIVQRLQVVGLAEQAMTALQQDPVSYARFFTSPSRGGVDAGAADVRAFLAAVGADPDVILAPEA